MNADRCASDWCGPWSTGLCVDCGSPRASSVEALADVLLASWAAQGSLTPPFDTDRDDARMDARAILTSEWFRTTFGGVA